MSKSKGKEKGDIVKGPGKVFCAKVYWKCEVAKHEGRGESLFTGITRHGRSLRGATEDLQLPVDNASTWTEPPT